MERADSVQSARCTMSSKNKGESDTKEYTASLIRVIDGDTVVVQIDLGFGVSIVRHVRLIGVNCPEMDAHIEGYHARNDCIAWWERNRNTATLTTDQSTDHYGRTLGDFKDPRGRTLSAYQLTRHCLSLDEYR